MLYVTGVLPLLGYIVANCWLAFTTIGPCALGSYITALDAPPVIGTLYVPLACVVAGWLIHPYGSVPSANLAAWNWGNCPVFK